MPSSSRQGQIALFARNFFRHPRMLGSLIPSSTFLVRRLLREVEWSRARLLVEYGPGVGTITREVLGRMRPDATLIALETNQEFVDYLRGSLADRRLQVIHGSAADVERVLGEQGRGRADYVISGIPFSTLPEEERQRILLLTRRVLQPDGALLVYQFSPKVLPYLQQNFTTVTRAFEPRNLLPAQLFICLP